MNDKVLTFAVDAGSLETALNDLSEVVRSRQGLITQEALDTVIDMLALELSFSSVAGSPTKIVIVVSEGHYKRVDALRRTGT